MRLEFSTIAKRDLVEIGDYIARDSPARAAAFVRRLQKKCRDILPAAQGYPGAGIGPAGLKRVPFGAYNIFFTVEAQLVRVERILHASRDASAQFA